MSAPMDDPRRAFFALSKRVDVLPVVHGSGDFALAARDRLTAGNYDCVAVPLPETFRDEVLSAVRGLPECSAVVQSAGDDDARFTMVPIDPCQPVIRALRIALEERIAIAFVDLEVRDFADVPQVYPDAYALKTLTPEEFAAAALPGLFAPEPESQRDRRLRWMAFALHRLELDFGRILFLPSLLDWPFIRDAYVRRLPYPAATAYFAPIQTHPVDAGTLAFFLGELPFITHLYNERRSLPEAESSLSVDGVKELIVETRDRLAAKRKTKKRIATQSLMHYLQFVRNLTLIRRRLKPDLVTLVEAAKRSLGDDFAAELIETAKSYPEQPERGACARFGPTSAELPSTGEVEIVSRLPGQRFEWRTIELRPEPPEKDKGRWSQVWNPFTQCSYPPEDSRIESFNLHVREQAKALLSSDLARVEKFTSSIKDGIDMRETLRHWHTGELFVRVMPPARGSVEVVVFLFEVPAPPEEYPWRATWFAEHQEESTLAFFATDYMSDMVGPGIAKARYGGALFLFPPRPIADIWRDPLFRETQTLEERLLAGAFHHSKERHVVVVSPVPLKASWRRLARRFGKVPIHMPLKRFSTSTIERLRAFHVLNGKEVRTYAADFIRRPE